MACASHALVQVEAESKVIRASRFRECQATVDPARCKGLPNHDMTTMSEWSRATGRKCGFIDPHLLRCMVVVVVVQYGDRLDHVAPLYAPLRPMVAHIFYASCPHLY